MQEIDEKVFNRLKVEINRTYYTFKRYMSPSTFAFLYFEGDLSVEDLGEFLRISDKFLKVDDNHYFINYMFTEQHGAFKASQNLLLNLDKHFENNASCIAIDKFDTNKTPRIVINRLMEILRETQKHSYTRIEDESILNDIL